MLDLLNLQKETSIECIFAELPISIQKRAEKYFSNGEEPSLIVINKVDNSCFVVCILTSFRVVRMHYEIKKNTFESDSGGILKDVSILLSDRSGLRLLNSINERSHLVFIHKSGSDISMGTFCLQELLGKFTRATLTLQKEWLDK